MVYSKLPPQPPPYSQQDARQPGPPSAPPAAMASAPTNEMPLNSIGPPAPYSNPTTVVQNNIVVTGGQGMICPKCNANIRLRVEHHATCSTYCMAAILCLFLLVFTQIDALVIFLYIITYISHSIQMLAMRLPALLLQLLLQNQSVLPQLQCLPGKLLNASAEQIATIPNIKGHSEISTEYVYRHQHTHKPMEKLRIGFLE